MRTLTRSETRMLAAAGLSACAALLAFAWSARASAARAAGAARESYATVAAQARRAAALQAERARVADRPRAEPDLVGRLQTCLHASGIDPAALTQVSVAEPTSAGGSGGAGGGSGGAETRLRRQQVALTLNPVRTSDVSRFLAAWREAEPLWTVRAVRAQHGGAKHEGKQAPEDDRGSVVLVLDNIFLDANPAIAPREVPR